MLEGTTIRASPRTLIVTFSNDPRELMLGLRKLLEEFGYKDREDFWWRSNNDSYMVKRYFKDFYSVARLHVAN